MGKRERARRRGRMVRVACDYEDCRHCQEPGVAAGLEVFVDGLAGHDHGDLEYVFSDGDVAVLARWCPMVLEFVVTRAVERGGVPGIHAVLAELDRLAPDPSGR